MRRSLAGAGAGAAAGALAVLAVISIAEGDAASPSPAADSDIERVRVEPVLAAPAPGATLPRSGTRSRQELTYLEVPTPLDVPPQTEVAVELSKCPKGSEAVTGYFQPERPGTFLDRSRPVLSTGRMWAIGAFNTTTTPEKVTFGLVCLSRVK